MLLMVFRPFPAHADDGGGGGGGGVVVAAFAVGWGAPVSEGGSRGFFARGVRGECAVIWPRCAHNKVIVPPHFVKTLGCCTAGGMSGSHTNIM
jgi:hypothetical protein